MYHQFINHQSKEAMRYPAVNIFVQHGEIQKAEILRRKGAFYVIIAAYSSLFSYLFF
jgi:hypothetical protein